MSEVVVRGKRMTIYKWGKNDVNVLCHNVALSNGTNTELRDSGISVGRITANCFMLLERHNIKTHLREWLGGDAFFAYRLEMFPIRVVVYRIATEEMARRHRLPVSERFGDLLVEYFFKDPQCGHLLLDTIDFRERGLFAYRPDQPISQDGMVSCIPMHDLFGPSRDVSTFLEILRREAKHAFLILEAAWGKEDSTLHSLALEFGADLDEGTIRIGDCIGPASWALEPFGNAAPSNDPAEVLAWYTRIAEATDRFPAHL